MDSSDAIQFLILIILLALSAFFSSAETSMTTANRIRIQSLAELGDNNAKILLKITDNSGKLLSTILIGNNIVNIGASSLQPLWLSAFLEMQPSESAPDFLPCWFYFLVKSPQRHLLQFMLKKLHWFMQNRFMRL